jgi:glycerate dehydrogenase
MQALADQLVDLIDAFRQGRPFNLVAGKHAAA